jgi:uncharacterized protein (DUF1501 family)
MSLERRTQVWVNRQGVVRRRDFLKVAAVTGMGAGLAGWAQRVSAAADDLRQRGKACILLWMQGGPSQFETFDPKPGHENGGETKAIDTSVPGIQIAENLPETARVMEHFALIRSMTSREGSHPRATSLLHTGYLPTASIQYPTLGAICAHEIARAECELPAFVQVGAGGPIAGGAGFLGVEYHPFSVPAAGQLPANTRPATDTARYQRRLGLLQRLEEDYALQGGGAIVADHQKMYGRAARMILSPQMKAFDLEQEQSSVREAYGRTNLGNACLLARRLVETGVTFVEVVSNGWDTHADNFTRTRQLAGGIDRPMAQLVRDLHQRGLLENTLVIWMGEFGRTPRINARTGRDHYPRAFSMAMAGCGVRGGQVIGRTDSGGVSVTDRPVTVSDLFQTFCLALGIDAHKENLSPIGRPIRIVDGGTPVREVFG